MIVHHLKIVFPSWNQKVSSPSPDNSLLEADAGPVDYTKHETIKIESVELTVTDSVSGITPPSLFFSITFIPFVCMCYLFAFDLCLQWLSRWVRFVTQWQAWGCCIRRRNTRSVNTHIMQWRNPPFLHSVSFNFLKFDCRHTNYNFSLRQVLGEETLVYFTHIQGRYRYKGLWTHSSWLFSVHPQWSTVKLKTMWSPVSSCRLSVKQSRWPLRMRSRLLAPPTRTRCRSLLCLCAAVRQHNCTSPHFVTRRNINTLVRVEQARRSVRCVVIQRSFDHIVTFFRAALRMQTQSTLCRVKSGGIILVSRSDQLFFLSL